MSAEALLLQYGYVFVFAGSILEGDATLLAASFLAHREYFTLQGVIGTAIVASTAFNELIYHVSRRGGKRFMERKAAAHPGYARVQIWVQKRSTVLLLFSRYMIGFRLAIPAACGAVGMRPMRFFAINLLGAVLWTVPVALAGYFLGYLLQGIWHSVREYEWHIAVVLLVVVTALLAWFDPELRRVADLFTRSRAFAVRSSARVRRLAMRTAGEPGRPRSDQK